MKKAFITAALSSMAVLSPLSAQWFPPCENVAFPKVTGQFTSPQQYTVSWPSIPGAYAYLIDETRPMASAEQRITRQFQTTQTSITVSHEAINDVTYQYRVHAVGGAGPGRRRS